ncbi:MAG: hypothetical protein VW522_09770, partial [Candidatus Neomarinimicrobiota bacterium]
VMYAMTAGKTLAYALFNLQNRGKLFLGHGQEVYVGQIVGLHSRDNDLPVNPTKAKQLTNIRAAGTDENLILVPHIKHTLEQALEFIEDDELVEVTIKNRSCHFHNIVGILFSHHSLSNQPAYIVIFEPCFHHLN